MNRVAGSHPVVPPPGPASERLKQAALQLEGVFVQRLFAAMRDTVPDDGFMPQSSAESTFTQLLDERFSEQVPKQWNGEHSLAQALYRQLSQRLAPPASETSGSEPK